MEVKVLDVYKHQTEPTDLASGFFFLRHTAYVPIGTKKTKTEVATPCKAAEAKLNGLKKRWPNPGQ